MENPQHPFREGFPQSMMPLPDRGILIYVRFLLTCVVYTNILIRKSAMAVAFRDFCIPELLCCRSLRDP